MAARDRSALRGARAHERRLGGFRKVHPDGSRALASCGRHPRRAGRDTSRSYRPVFGSDRGFTGLSERLGDGVVPVVSSYLDLASTAIADENGTIDKFIGDAVMAFWGAPRPD